MEAAKIIVVTGGNRGIGLEICRQLAVLGHHVIMGARDLTKGKAAAATLQGQVDVYALDMADEASIREFGKALQAAVKRVDVLVNNAGIISSGAGTMQVTASDMRALYDTNCLGPLLLSQALHPLLRASGAGRIINMSSQMGAWNSLGGGYAAYRLSKTTLNAMTLLMANELRSDGISVNAMCPGWVRTDMGGASAPRTVSQGADTAVWLATAAKIPTGKFFSDRREVPW